MASNTVGAYIRGLQSDQDKSSLDPKITAPRLLKILVPAPRSYSQLLSLTRWDDDALRAAIEELKRDELIQGSDNEYALSDLGYKAQFVVSS